MKASAVSIKEMDGKSGQSAREREMRDGIQIYSPPKPALTWPFGDATTRATKLGKHLCGAKQSMAVLICCTVLGEWGETMSIVDVHSICPDAG